jgi:hypothetical protein
MNDQERAALIADLRGLVENRAKLTEDVKEILKAEIPKLIADATRGLRPPMPDLSPFVTADDLREGALPGDLPPGVESPIPRRRFGGPMEYVVGRPPATPVLRALKQPLFDTIIVPVEGIMSDAEIQLFADTKHFPDGSRKLRRHCNLSIDGQLGYPLEYDLTALELRFEKWSHPDDVQRVLRGLHLSWYFGQNTPWLRLSGSGFKPLFVLPHEVEDARAALQEQIERFAASGGVWPAWTHDMRGAHPYQHAEGAEGEPEPVKSSPCARRISSTESFRCGVEVNTGGELHGPVTMKVLMQDTLYAQV